MSTVDKLNWKKDDNIDFVGAMANNQGFGFCVHIFDKARWKQAVTFGLQQE